MNNQNTGNMELSESNKKRVYRIGGVAALLTVAVAFSEGAINFLPGGNAPVETVVDWFTQLQSNWFLLSWYLFRSSKEVKQRENVK